MLMLFCKVSNSNRIRGNLVLLYSKEFLILRALMKLLLDFGNTFVKAAVSDGGSLTEFYCGPATLSRLKSALSDRSADGGMWCAVKPVSADICAWMREMGLVQLTHTTAIPVRNLYSTPETLGMDRLAAAVGAWSMHPEGDKLVIDAGTAITVDFVSADGAYHGGNIAPGIGLRFKALHEFTGALPLVDPDGALPYFGSDTETAIRSGVINGVQNELEGYISHLKTQYPSLLVFLTGGDSEHFVIKGKCPIFAVQSLVLQGLDCILKYNEQKN